MPMSQAKTVRRAVPRVRIEFAVSVRALRGLRRREFARAVKEQAVLQLVCDGRLSQGRGAELLGMDRASFLDLMARRGMPHIRMSRDELRDEIHVAEGVVRGA